MPMDIAPTIKSDLHQVIRAPQPVAGPTISVVEHLIDGCAPPKSPASGGHVSVRA